MEFRDRRLHRGARRADSTAKNAKTTEDSGINDYKRVILCLRVFAARKSSNDVQHSTQHFLTAKITTVTKDLDGILVLYKLRVCALL
jgi:hypothetical protein